MNRNIAVILSVGGGSGFRAQMLQSAAVVRGFDKEVSKAGSGASRVATSLKAAFAGMALVVGMFLSHAVQGAVRFEAAMRNVNSISGLTEQQLSGLSNQVLELSTRVPQSAQNLAEGLYEIASSGFQGAEGMKVLEASAVAASAGLTTTDVASKAIVASLNAYGLSANDAADVSDILFQTVNLGVVSFEELATQLGDVVGGAAAAGVALDEVGAATAAMTLSGLSAAESTTSLNQLIRALIDPSDALAGLFQDLGFESGKAALDTLGLHGTMEALREATGGNIETLIALFPEIRSARGAFALMAAEGANYARTFDAITNEQTRAGATQRAFNEQMKGLGNQWKVFVNNLEAGAIRIGTALIPVLRRGMEGLQEFGGAAVRVLSGLWRNAQPAFRSLQQAFAELARLGGVVVKEVSPIAKAVGGIIAGAAITGLRAFSEALSTVAGFLADHPGLVRAVAVAYGGLLLGRLMTAAGAFMRLQAGLLAVRAGLAGLTAQSVLQNLALRASYLGDALYSVFSMGNLRNIGSFKTAFEGLGGALSAAAPTIAGAAIVGGLYAFVTASEKAEAAARQMRQEIEKDIDPKSMSSIRLGIQQFEAELESATAANDSYGGRLRRTLFETAQGLTPLSDGARRSREAMEEAGEAADFWRGKLAQLEHDVGTVANATGLSRSEVEGFLQSMEDYDPSSTTQTTTDLTRSVEAMAAAARSGTPAANELAESAETVGDATSNATDRVQALEDAIDALIGTMLGSSNAAIAYQEAVDSLTGAVMENGATLDINTEQGRAVASSINEAAEAAIDHANAIAEETGSTRDGVEALSAYREELQQQLVDLGFSEEAASQYLATLGLTPDNVSTLFQLEGADAATQQAADLEALLVAIDTAKTTGEVNLDSSEFDHNAEAIGDWIEQIAIAAPEASVTLDDSQFIPAATQVEEWASKYDDSSPEAEALLNIIDPQNAFSTLSEAAANWDSAYPVASAGLDASTANAAFGRSREQLAAWNASRGTATVGADNGPARTSLATARDGLHTWDASQGSATVGVTDNATARMNAIMETLRSLDGRTALVTVTHRSIHETVNVGVRPQRMPMRWGGIHEDGIVHAQTGLVQAGIQRSPAIYFAEPETGGEAFVPKNGNPYRSVPVLKEAAGWYGMDIVPQGMRELMAVGGGGQSVTVHAPSHINVRATGGIDSRELMRITKAAAEEQRRELVATLRREMKTRR